MPNFHSQKGARRSAQALLAPPPPLPPWPSPLEQLKHPPTPRETQPPGSHFPPAHEPSANVRHLHKKRVTRALPAQPHLPTPTHPPASTIIGRVHLRARPPPCTS